jgi:hypothetical protein
LTVPLSVCARNVSKELAFSIDKKTPAAMRQEIIEKLSIERVIIFFGLRQVK